MSTEPSHRLRIGDRERTATAERLAARTPPTGGCPSRSSSRAWNAPTLSAVVGHPFFPPLVAAFVLWRLAAFRPPIRRSPS
jgi:hypothetical protein